MSTLLDSDISEDALLDGRLKFFQPKQGYRAAIDPVFLAAAINAREGETVLDVGAGAGAASLCLAHRAPGVQVTGVEVQRPMVHLANRNAKANGLGDRIDVMVADLKSPPMRIAPGTFHHVMTNPPFAERGRGRASPNAAKAAATLEGDVSLQDWLRFCLLMARPKGAITLIHRADRLDDVLAAIGDRAGDVLVFPLWPGPGKKPAKRVLIRCRKGVRTPLRLSPGLVLHETDGSFTAEAAAVLRHGQGLDL